MLSKFKSRSFRVSKVSRLSKVRVGIRVSVRIRVSLALVIGWGWDFLTWSEWSYMSGFRRVATSLH